MIAYIAWHRPAAGVGAAAYEQALERFHRSLARVPPSGFEGSCSFHADAPPQLAPGAEQPRGEAAPDGGKSRPDEEGRPGEPSRRGEEGSAHGYEDWYLVDGWSALGVLEEAAVAHGHQSRHDAVAGRAALAVGAVYRLSEGHPELAEARISVWVAAARDHAAPALADLLGDGMDRASSTLWRRCLGLGPAPEYCLLAREAPPGAAPARLPVGWRSLIAAREPVW